MKLYTQVDWAEPIPGVGRSGQLVSSHFRDRTRIEFHAQKLIDEYRADIALCDFEDRVYSYDPWSREKIVGKRIGIIEEMRKVFLANSQPLLGFYLPLHDITKEGFEANQSVMDHADFVQIPCYSGNKGFNVEWLIARMLLRIRQTQDAFKGFPVQAGFNVTHKDNGWSGGSVSQGQILSLLRACDGMGVHSVLLCDFSKPRVGGPWKRDESQEWLEGVRKYRRNE